MVELSILESPDPTGLSVAVILKALAAPVSDFNTRLNVPSPAPTILAVTPYFNSFILSLREANVSVLATVKVDEETVELATKLPDDQSPLSNFRHCWVY